MKVAYVCGDRGVRVFGQKGSSVHVQEILRAFTHRGDRVDLYAANLGGVCPSDLSRIRVHPLLTEAQAKSIRAGEISPLEVNLQLRRALEESGEEYDLVYERHALWSSSAMEHAAARGIPGVLEVNAPLVAEQLAHRRLDDPNLAERVVADAMKAAQIRVAVSSGVAARHREYGLTQDDFLIVPNGINPIRFSGIHASARSRHPDSIFTIGFLGTLKPWHGLDVLTEAFIQMAKDEPSVRLLIVGDGPMRGEVELRIESVGLTSRATFTGAVDPADVPVFLAQMDVGTAPYADAENHYFSPLKVFEYMAVGLPVVASRVGQLPDLISHGSDGWLVEPANVDELMACLDRVRLDPDGAQMVARRARRRVLDHHSWGSILERILRNALARVGPIDTPIADVPEQFTGEGVLHG